MSIFQNITVLNGLNKCIAFARRKKKPFIESFSAVSTYLLGKGLRQEQPPALLPAACRIQRGNNKLRRIFNLLFFVYFFWKWAKTLKKLEFVYLWAKAIPLLHAFNPAILWNLRNTHEKINFKQPDLKKYNEFWVKLKFSEGSFNFPQNSIIFCAFYQGGYTARSPLFITPGSSKVKKN